MFSFFFFFSSRRRHTRSDRDWSSDVCSSDLVEYNFRALDEQLLGDGEGRPWLAEIASSVGTDWPTYRREGPGVSAFALEDGVVYHTYSAYERGIDGLWAMYQWLDRAP